MDLPSHKAHSSQAKDSADLSHSRLIEVPADLFRLHHLRTLRLDNNSLSSVPWSSLMALESLTHVNLSHNKLSELPEALAKWNTVEVLDVSYNCIAAFSQALRPLLLRAYYIIPLRPFVYTSGSIYHIRFDHEDYTLECPHLTRALIKQFGSKLPAILHAQYPSRYHYSRASMAVVAANPQIEIMDYASSSPHIFWQPSWASSTALRSVRPGKPYWKLAAGASPRVRLEGAPCMCRGSHHMCVRLGVRKTRLYYDTCCLFDCFHEAHSCLTHAVRIQAIPSSIRCLGSRRSPPHSQLSGRRTRVRAASRALAATATATTNLRLTARRTHARTRGRCVGSSGTRRRATQPRETPSSVARRK